MRRVLDVCCCEGGASAGYERAGFTPYGVDLFVDYTQKRYPYPSVKGDALTVLQRLLAGEAVEFNNGERLTLADFDMIHASPPCQRHTAGTRAVNRSNYPDLIGPVRTLLKATGLPYVIENVPGAPLESPLILCGTMFQLCAQDDDGTPLELWRHRLFESNVMLRAPECEHGWHSEQVAGVYGGARRDKSEARNVRHGGYVPASKAVAEQLLGIDWMTWKGLHQSLPPVYTEYVGSQIAAYLNEEAA